MTQTLRRELRLKFLEYLNGYIPLSALNVDVMAEKLADIALTVRGISGLPAGSDPAWLMRAGASSNEVADLLSKEQREKETARCFEEAMGLGALPWWNNADLKALLKFLTDKTPLEIKKFATWSRRDFSTFDPVKARRNPRQVMEFWSLAFPTETTRVQQKSEFEKALDKRQNENH
jgi:hypothetical protein